MKILKKVAYAFALCAGLTYIGLKFTWPDTGWYTIFMALQFAAFVLLLVFLLLFSKLIKMQPLQAYLLATVCAYIAYLFMLKAINNPDDSIGVFLAKIHTGRDFVPTLLSFLLANTAILIYTFFEERSKKVA
jgi:hypothetical protein